MRSFYWQGILVVMSKKPSIVKRITNKLKTDNEKGARQAVLEDLFYDFNRSKSVIYRMNFMRGIFFGFGTVIGGTLLVALILAILNLLVDVPGGIGEFIRNIVNIVQEK